MKALIRLLFPIFLLLSPVVLRADGQNLKTNFVYDADFEMNFDNREFYKSTFSESMTIFGARLTPSVGVEVIQSPEISHRIMLGVDVKRDFGSPAKLEDYFGEISLYYNMNRDFGKTQMSLYAGIFPRRFMSDRYSEAFFSDSLKFYDNNLEGLLLKFKRPKASFDLGCDWSGRIGNNVREKFMIYSSGEGQIAPALYLGYAAYMYHFANSNQVSGVVDNVLINPWVKLDLSAFSGLQSLSFKLGWLQAMQNDRKHIGIYTFPCGGELDFEVKNWNVGIRNNMYYGMDLMPYYNRLDSGDIKYGNSLYLGDPFYRVHESGGSHKAGVYDRFEVFWQPHVCDFMSLRIGAFFHFNDFRYSGCQQVVRVDFNLGKMLKRK